MNLTSLREGLRDALLQTGMSRVDPYTPESVNPPCMFLGSPTITYDIDQSGGVTVTLPIWLLVGAADMKRGQAQIDPYLATEGDQSIPNAVHEDPSLGDRVDSVRVTVAQPTGLVTVGDTNYTGVRVDVDLMVS